MNLIIDLSLFVGTILAYISALTNPKDALALFIIGSTLATILVNKTNRK